MFSLLHLLSYIGALAAFLFVTLSLASGLLWMAELIEEHSRYAKVVGMRAIYVIIAIYVLLVLTDGLPILPTLFSIACHVVYLQNFSPSWPFISLTSPTFILSCLLVVADHFTWFFHFAAKAQEAKRYRQPKYRYGAGAGKGGYDDPPGFMDVAAFFAICVWFIPLFLFLSLSANDNALPSSIPSGPPSPAGGVVDLSTSGAMSHPAQRQRSSTSLVKSLLNPLFALLPRLRRRGRRDDEGLLAPRTPVRGSPLHSPVPMPAQSYFPWGDDSASSTSMTPSYSGTSLVPEARAASGRNSAPPPRRVASEAQVQQINPRGLAIRHGRHALMDAQLTGEPEIVSGSRPSVDFGGAGMGNSSSTEEGPRMSLGPTGAGVLGATEVIEGKRKAD